MLSRWLFSLLLLGFLVWWLGPKEVIGQLGALQPSWVALALMVGCLQVLLSALRWWFTAKTLGVALSFPQALREYYLASLINQILPGGVVGDAYRAKRHADLVPSKRPAWWAVIIERFSGQLMLMLLTVVILISSNTWQAALGRLVEDIRMEPSATVGVVALGLVAMAGLVIRRWGNTLAGLGADLYRAMITAFWPGGRLLVQLISSWLIVMSYIAVMVFAAWAVGVELPWMTLAVLAPPLLLAMVIPLTVSGWGLRELMAAAVWSSVGLAPAQGVAVSMAYGLLIFLTAVPGVVMWRAKSAQRA